MTAALTIHYRDQILAALAEAGPVPLSTRQVAIAIGTVPDEWRDPVRVTEIWAVLDGLRKQGRAERIRFDGVRAVYWRASGLGVTP